MRKTVCIVNYNTPELVRAAIWSIRKHGGKDYMIYVFDNSDRKPLGTPSYPVPVKTAVIDNTRGQVINFEEELAKYPRKNAGIGCALGCNYGSVKHMMSIEWLVQHMEEGFVLCDSDILVRQSFDSFFDTDVYAVSKRATHGGMAKWRLLPMLCWLNAPKLRAAGIHYFDPQRSWALFPERDDERNWYDTGASLLEDLQKGGYPWREEDIFEYIYHLDSGSWRRNGKDVNDWLEQNRDLWDDTPYERGVRDVAMCAIVRCENRYLRDWVEWHQRLGVARFFIYDNSRPGDERPAEVLQEYIHNGTVEIVPWPRYGNVQCAAYDDCYRHHGRDYAWIGFLDIDELVHINDGSTLPELLNRHSGKADVVVMQWRMMGDSGLVHYDPRPLWERFTIPAPQKRPEMCHVKSFVRGGIHNLSFRVDMHCPLQPSMRVVNPDGSPALQQSISDHDEKSVAWIDHYFTKTAEEYVQKMRRGFPVWDWHTEKKLATAAGYFFQWNEKTPEKYAILKAFHDSLPNTIKMMEHITRENARWGYTRLVADKGYQLRSKVTGQVYDEITVPDPERFEAVPRSTESTEKTEGTEKKKPTPDPSLKGREKKAAEKKAKGAGAKKSKPEA